MTHDTTSPSILDAMIARPVPGIDGRFEIDIAKDWSVLYTFGGVTLAIALATARTHLGRPDLDLISSQATYIAPISPGTIALHVEVLRSGRRGAQVVCRMWCLNDAERANDVGAPPHTDLMVDIVFGAAEPALVPFVRPGMPADAGTPEGATSREELDRGGFVDIPFHAQTEWRLAAGGFGAVGGVRSADLEPDARSLSWFRLRQSPITATGAWDPAALAVPGDILGPAVAAVTGPSGHFFVVTLQLSMQWFAPLTTDWVCQHATAVRSANGFVTGVAELWSEDGDLVAFATQNAMLRPFERVKADGLAGEESQG